MRFFKENILEKEKLLRKNCCATIKQDYLAKKIRENCMTLHIFYLSGYMYLKVR